MFYVVIITNLEMKPLVVIPLTVSCSLDLEQGVIQINQRL